MFPILVARSISLKQHLSFNWYLKDLDLTITQISGLLGSYTEDVSPISDNQRCMCRLGQLQNLFELMQQSEEDHFARNYRLRLCKAGFGQGF